MIVLLSILIAVLFLILERSIGIGWDFHPDASTYVNTSSIIFEGIVGDARKLLNNGHYLVVYLMGSNVGVLTGLNILIYSITNHVIYSQIRKKTVVDSALFYIAILLYIFNPYRLHLAVSILKDTVIIFLLAVLICYRGKIFSFSLMFIYRFAALLYLPLLIKKDRIFIYILFGSVLFILVYPLIRGHILEVSMVDMQFRDFDRVSSFREMSEIGAIVRAMVWPVITLTGYFVFMSPALYFVPLAVGSLVILLVSVKISAGEYWLFVIPLLIMSLFSLLVTGYTSYYRYIFPVLTLIPLYIARLKSGEAEYD